MCDLDYAAFLSYYSSIIPNAAMVPSGLKIVPKHYSQAELNLPLSQCPLSDSFTQNAKPCHLQQLCAMKSLDPYVP